MPAPKKPSHIAQQAWDEADLPEWTAENFARAIPFKDALPQQFETWKRGRGRPKADQPKVQLALRMAVDVVEAVKATGRGYNARVERVLREAIAKGVL